jgi:hypothetical protein
MRESIGSLQRPDYHKEFSDAFLIFEQSHQFFVAEGAAVLVVRGRQFHKLVYI